MATQLSRRTFLASSVAALAATKSDIGLADEVGTALTDDYSRGELFRKYVEGPWEASNSGKQKSLAIPKSFAFPTDVTYDCTVNIRGVCVTDVTKPRTKPMMFGVDISHYTDRHQFSFNQLRDQQVAFVQMKSSQGDHYRDDNFPTFWAAAGKLTGNRKVYRGAYHFLTADADGNKQADWFLSILDKVGSAPDDMSPGVDLEWDVYKSTGDLDHWKGKGTQYIIDTVMACLTRIEEKTGRLPVLYTGRSWFGPDTVPLARFGEFEKFPLWVFDYDPRRKIEERPALPDSKVPAALWQFSSSASVALSYPHGLDASVFYGTDADFKKVFGIA